MIALLLVQVSVPVKAVAVLVVVAALHARSVEQEEMAQKTSGEVYGKWHKVWGVGGPLCKWSSL